MDKPSSVTTERNLQTSMILSIVQTFLHSLSFKIIRLLTCSQ